MRKISVPKLLLSAAFAGIAVLAVACGGGGSTRAGPTPVPPSPTPDPLPHGAPLSPAALDNYASIFTDNPLMGGQVAPRQYKWVTEDVAMFVQFDKPKPADATALQYVGVAVKGIFCSEAVADRSFTHFDRLSAPTYGQGTPAAGEKGYWLTALALDKFDNGGRKVVPGIDYGYLPTAAPSCGANLPEARFDAPGAHKLTKEDMTRLASLVTDPILTGGQVAPRNYGWVNNDDAIFLQFNAGNPSAANPKFDPATATSLRYLGLAARGEFCKSNIPGESTHADDFPHFHRYEAPAYAEGHGGPPHAKGIWLLWIATDTFEAQNREVKPGVDRLQSLIPIEQSC